MKPKPPPATDAAALRRRAEKTLRAQPPAPVLPGQPKVGGRRTLHELHVHQIELEMQNAELQEARDRLEVLLEKYTDLYDFAPVGYFSLDESGVILEVNLTGAALLGVERSRLVERRLQRFAAPESRTTLQSFLVKVFTRPEKQICELLLLNEDGIPFWADLQAVPAVSPNGPRKWCRLAVSDITDLKRAEDAQLRLEALAVANKELKQEIVQRLAVEQALRQSELEQRQLLTQARHMHAQLRHFSHQILQAQEEERKRISRELHDEIAQTLVGISVHLKAMTPEVTGKNQAFLKTLIDAKRLVEKSVDVVHRFARDLRPTLLDDLGLIPALHSYMKEFTTRTKVRIHFTAFAGVEQLGSTRRTVLYRVTQSALANIAQHAQATQVKVSIHRIEDTVRMEIQDDGKAFDVERVLFAKRYKRLGLLGMRERVEMVGGSFSVESTPGKGTIIRAQIPFGNAGKRRKTR